MYAGFTMINDDVRHTTERQSIGIFNKHDEIVKNVLMVGDELIKKRFDNKGKTWYLSGMNINKAKGTRLSDEEKINKVKKFILMSHFGNIFYNPDISVQFLKEMKDFLGSEWHTSPFLEKYRKHYKQENTEVCNEMEEFLNWHIYYYDREMI